MAGGPMPARAEQGAQGERQRPSLPDVMTVRYTADGLPEQIREKTTLFLLPVIGLLAWLINGVWGLIMSARNQQSGAYLLWGGAIIVQICSFLALVSLIG